MYHFLAAEHEQARQEYLASFATRNPKIITAAAFEYMPKLIVFNEFRGSWLGLEMSLRRFRGDDPKLDDVIMELFGENHIDKLAIETEAFNKDKVSPTPKELVV